MSRSLSHWSCHARTLTPDQMGLIASARGTERGRSIFGKSHASCDSHRRMAHGDLHSDGWEEIARPAVAWLGLGYTGRYDAVHCMHDHIQPPKRRRRCGPLFSKDIRPVLPS